MRSLTPEQFYALQCSVSTDTEFEDIGEDDVAVCRELEQDGLMFSVFIPLPGEDEDILEWHATEAGYRAERVHRAYLASVGGL